MPAGLAWGMRGLLYEHDFRIWLAEERQAPKPVTQFQQGEIWHLLPQWLPGETTFLYTVRPAFLPGDEQLVAQRLTSGRRQVLLQNASDGRYLPSGHLVFLRMGTLFTMPFDHSTLAATGDPVAVLSRVMQVLTANNTTQITGAGQFSISPTGHLAYVSSDIVPYRGARLVTIDRTGSVTALPAPIRSYLLPRLSPDGRRVAVHIRPLSADDLFLYDLSRNVLTKLASGRFGYLVWSPNGQRLTFQQYKEGRLEIDTLAVDGSAPLETLTDFAALRALKKRDGGEPASRGGGQVDDIEAAEWTPDGRELIALENERDIIALARQNGTWIRRPIVQTSAVEDQPALSPDGRWLAYASDTSGRREVYLQPYTGPGPRIQVSTGGGSSPAWHRNGRELFFLAPGDSSERRTMMAVDIDLSGPVRVGTPHVLFTYTPTDLWLYSTPERGYDVSPDGQRFFSLQPIQLPPTPPVTQIHLVLNWIEEMSARVAGSSRATR